MYKFKDDDMKVPVFSWCPNIEKNAMAQIDNLARLPFVFNRVVVMSDCHSGYGMPIGGVLATENVILPNCVGVDIGCGMSVVKTGLIDMDKETLKKIVGNIRKVIPVGFAHQKSNQDEELMPKIAHQWADIPIVEKEYFNALKQLGTLGGGNHFIEIQQGGDSHVWIMLHSGSRNLGYKVAKHYNQLAQKLCKKWYSNIPEFKGEDGLAFLPVDSDEGQAYIREMQYCVDFALANRKLMMGRIQNIFADIFDSNDNGDRISGIEFGDMINIAHNYVSLENHFGKNVWVHRKGATLARKGIIGIIPGSQGSSSYIVEGLGNPDSFESCSHGAGRLMSRTKARETLNLEDEIKKMDDQGIIHGLRNKNNLDEASSAYKNIDEVMFNQSDLVKILVKLNPLGVIKG